MGVGEQDEYKRTALMWASEKGMTNMVEKLLAAGAKAETTDKVKREEQMVRGGRCTEGVREEEERVIGGFHVS